MNRNLETEIENGLKRLYIYINIRLNQLDDNLEQLNNEIIDNCRTLDVSEENIRELLAVRTAENISKAEPFFVQKKKVIF
jgi:hypothetical protein